MADDVLINKSAIIERCVRRAREEYAADPASFASNFTRQDAAILNIQRACEAALDMGQHLIRRERLGVPQSARDVVHQPESLPTAKGWRQQVSERDAPGNRQDQCRWQECRLDLRYAWYRTVSTRQDRIRSRRHHSLCNREPFLPRRLISLTDE